MCICVCVVLCFAVVMAGRTPSRSQVIFVIRFGTFGYFFFSNDVAWPEVKEETAIPNGSPVRNPPHRMPEQCLKLELHNLKLNIWDELQRGVVR